MAAVCKLLSFAATNVALLWSFVLSLHIN